MNDFPRLYLPGGRILKTGIAVFLTVAICPSEFPVFAVITAMSTEYRGAKRSDSRWQSRYHSASPTALFGDAAHMHSQRC